jgi:RHS repeat-associated protein
MVLGAAKSVKSISILPQRLEDMTEIGKFAAKRSEGEDGQGFRRAEPAGGKRSMGVTDGQSVGPGRSALPAWPPRGVAQKAETGGNILSGPFADAVLGPGDIVLGLSGAISTTTVQTFYYSSQWRVIQDDSQLSPSATPQIADQYVWGEAYVNELVLRDRHADNGSGENYGIANSGLDERLYALQDANWNVTTLIDTSGTPQERFVYDPYGNVTILSGNTFPSNVDNYNWVYRFQGGRVDLATGLYTFQHRQYNPVLGTWVEQDPFGAAYVDGANLYEFVLGNPLAGDDPLGLEDRYHQGARPSPTEQPNPPPGKQLPLYPPIIVVRDPQGNVINTTQVSVGEAAEIIICAYENNGTNNLTTTPSDSNIPNWIPVKGVKFGLVESSNGGQCAFKFKFYLPPQARGTPATNPNGTVTLPRQAEILNSTDRNGRMPLVIIGRAPGNDELDIFDNGLNGEYLKKKLPIVVTPRQPPTTNPS